MGWRITSPTPHVSAASVSRCILLRFSAPGGSRAGHEAQASPASPDRRPEGQIGAGVNPRAGHCRPKPLPSSAILRLNLVKCHFRRSAATQRNRQERSVKPSAQPTLVRTQHLPAPAKTARLRCRSSYCAVHGRTHSGRGVRAARTVGVHSYDVRVTPSAFHGRPRTSRADAVSGLEVNGGAGACLPLRPSAVRAPSQDKCRPERDR
jgi:hypothetical protein